jgi:hypothetical protein
MIELGAFTYDISLMDIQRRHQFFRGREVSCRCVRTIQVLETCRQFLVIGQESFFSVGDWILDLPARSLCGETMTSHEERFIPQRQKLDQLSVVKDYSAVPRLEYR